MAPSGKESEKAETQRGVFATTHWSVVLAAGDSESPLAAEALEKLCRTYWYPLYVYVRRRGYEAPDAQDLTQDFFYRLLDRDWLAQVDRRKGKFRSFLLVAMNHFLANEWDRAKTVKRGGRIFFQAYQDDAYEERFQEDASGERSPEQLYEQHWALALLETVLVRLREEATTTGRLEQFNELKGFLTGEKRSMTYADLAAKLSATEAALKMAVQRLRRRYGELLREEIANTVADPNDVEDELRHLMTVLSG
ncbi:MAG TPA: sigma-70 family RNA polymerase sigma factor [Candidatus Paceibacterota bacterium]|nr:sigma-70 family RNA polymerase sigma factor [Candidatus Paceibacterota bacterium]